MAFCFAPADYDTKRGERLDSVTKTKLANGLTVHLKEIHTAPIISHWVWYRIGSRDESPGITGISHWVEHMQFKGTPTFPPSIFDKAISREGGVWNAFTHLDWTTYYETLPADKIDLALRLEADRMVNSLFDPGEVESERTVILSEREGSENEPLFRLGEAVQTAAFPTHSYGHEVIGSREDLLRIQRDDLYQPLSHVLYSPECADRYRRRFQQPGDARPVKRALRRAARGEPIPNAIYPRSNHCRKRKTGSQWKAQAKPPSCRFPTARRPQTTRISSPLLFLTAC